MASDPGQKLGVCSWSLKPESAPDLVRKVHATGVRWIQLHLDPIRLGEWDLDETMGLLKAAAIGVASGMMSMKGEDYSTLESIRQTGGIAPDETWEENLQAARENALIAKRIGLGLVTFHAGFLPHGLADGKRGRMISRLAELARVFGEGGAQAGLETGQEDADTLLAVLGDVNASLPAPGRVGVNFDPANIILYGMGDPAASAPKLAPHIVQVHMKDATPTATPGTWGTETPAGAGAVGWPGFLSVLRCAGVQCPLMIERESGDARVQDAAAAARMIEKAGGLR